MRKFLNAIFLMMSLLLTVQIKSQINQVTILEKNQTFISPQEDMVVMDKYLYCEYDYTVRQYDTLKAELEKYNAFEKSQDSIVDSLVGSYEKLIFKKDAEITSYARNYESTKQILLKEITAREKLQVEYSKLEEKRSKTKRWRNVFMGASALLSGIIVLSIVH